MLWGLGHHCQFKLETTFLNTYIQSIHLLRIFLTIHRTKLPFVCTGENLLVQRFCLFKLPLFQITGGLQIKHSTQCLHRNTAGFLSAGDSRSIWNIPGYSSSWPHLGHRAPALSGRSPGPSDSNTPPPHTCPGSGTARPSCLTAWPHPGDLFLEPGVKNSESETASVPLSTLLQRALLESSFRAPHAGWKPSQDSHTTSQKSSWSLTSARGKGRVSTHVLSSFIFRWENTCWP